MKSNFFNFYRMPSIDKAIVFNDLLVLCLHILQIECIGFAID